MKQQYQKLSMRENDVHTRKHVKYFSSETLLHWHDEIEIIYFLSGNIVTSCNLTELELTDGDILVINSRELHRTVVSGCSNAFYCFQINSRFFNNLIGNEYVIFNNLIRDPECSELLDRAIAVDRKKNYQSALTFKRIMFEFFELLARKHTRAVLCESDYNQHINKYDTMNSVFEYIDNHYTEDLSVNALAEQFFISPSYFAHLFKRRAGKGVTEYINDIRIEHAKSLIEKGELSIGEIASSVGFNDINYFSRKFKSTVKLTPSGYKKSIKE